VSCYNHRLFLDCCNPMPALQPAPATQESSGRWREFGRLAAVLFAFAFIAGNGTHWLLQNVVGQHHAFGSWNRMYDFHHRHPAQYIAVVAFFYALFVATWGVHFRTAGWWRHLALFCSFVLVLIFSSAAAGALWAVHDMQAGYFPSWERRWSQIGGYMVGGVTLGWLIVAISFPLNLVTTLLAYAAAYFFTQRHLDAGQ
jgi:hypothetical protein